MNIKNFSEWTKFVEESKQERGEEEKRWGSKEWMDGGESDGTGNEVRKILL